MHKTKPWIVGLYVAGMIGSACGVTTWKGGVSGSWEVPTNWAGGFPDSNATVRLNHDRQTSVFTVIVQTPAITDKLWIDTYGDIPVHLRVNAAGSLQLNSMRMGFKEQDRVTSFTIDGGSVWGLDPVDPAITNTAFLIGNNPDCEATMSVLNNGLLSVQGSTGLIVASSKESIGRLTVTNGMVQIRDSLILGKGPGSNGKMTLAGTSTVSITGALHIAKLDNGAIMPTGTVHMAGGTLDCGTLNVGAHGNGSLTLHAGNIYAGTGGITVGLSNADGRFDIHGGTLQATNSFMNIGHTDSNGLLSMSDGTVRISGPIRVGSGSRSYGRIDQSGGILSASQLIIGEPLSATGTLNLYGGVLTVTNFLSGAGGTAQCNLYGGELHIQGTDNTALQVSNSCINLQQTMIQWANSNVTDWVINAVDAGTLCFSNGVAPGTYSTNGYDGRIISGTAALYWDNLDNSSQFGQSAIWVELLSSVALYDTWTAEYELGGSDAVPTADPDLDGLDNLSEYGLGGNPANATEIGIVPSAEIRSSTAFEYVYRRRTDAVSRGLDYVLETTTNLVPGSWTTNGIATDGISESDDGFLFVTNQISTTLFPSRFIRLRIGIE